MIIDGINKDRMKLGIERFINALFGANDIAPTKDEFGMNAANGVALRSSDLSRQVGASIFSNDGRVLVQGCNEVPKAFGGTYWDGESPDYRDIKIGRDSNDILKIDVLTDLVDRLKRNGILKDEVAQSGSSSQIVDVLIGRSKGLVKFEAAAGSLKNSKILDLTEYGRVVHAEMNAICDAARSGVALGNATLYTTTFPCHNCTKHILAAGVGKVVYLEPYPKSKAKELHNNEISIEQEEVGKVGFIPFLGITPRMYRDLFSKAKRKRDGKAVQWQHGAPAPMVDIVSNEYIALEKEAIKALEGVDENDDSDEQIDLEARVAIIEDNTGPYDATNP
jgi:deoxycytidylate deaminase